LKGPSTKSSNCSDKFERQGGMTSQSHRNLDSYAFIFGEQNLTTIPTIVAEIKDVDRLLDFKHDMKKISKECMKALEDKKKAQRTSFNIHFLYMHFSYLFCCTITMCLEKLEFQLWVKMS
jgi:hypothetical protein